MGARKEMLRLDCDRALTVSLQRNVPDGMTQIPPIGEIAHAEISGDRTAGWRAIGLIASNLILEKKG